MDNAEERSVRSLTISRMGLSGVAVMAIAASLLSAMPTPAAQAVSALQAAQRDPADDRFAAAAVLGWVPRDELAMSDKDFVIVLWEKADEFFHPEVKKAAKDAFADVNDDQACAEFIRTGIFAANKRDSDLKVLRAQRDAERLAAAQELGWVPADDDARWALLRSTNNNFIVDLYDKAEAGSEVRKAADVARKASEESQLAFIATGIHTAAETDRDNVIAAGKEAELKAQQAKLLREIKASAIAAALGRVATEFELEHSQERDLIYKIKMESPGKKIQLAGAAAYDSEKPENWRTFLSTGVHVARAADIAERDRAEAAENERQVREIMNNAKFDGYQPKLVEAADLALQGNNIARVTFLKEGKDKAAKLDAAQPTAYMVIALKGSRSNRCIQVAVSVSSPTGGANADNAPTELWDCDENGRQRWELRPISGTTFALRSVNSKKCLAVPPGKNAEDVGLVQLTCAASTQQQWEFIDTGKDTMELRSVASNKVVSVPGSATSNSSSVGQANNSHALDQQWRVIDFSHQQQVGSPPTGKAIFVGAQSGRCIQVAGSAATPDEGSNANGAPIELWDCDARVLRQDWEFVPVAGNRFALKNAHVGKCLDVAGGSVASDTAVVQYTCGDQANQQWVLVRTANVSSLLRNAMTGTYLDVRGGATANGSPIRAWPANGGDDQRWIPLPVSPHTPPPDPCKWVIPHCNKAA
jgi:hypothetical protein